MKVADRGLRCTLFILVSVLSVMCILSIPAYAESTTAVRCIDADGKDMGTQDCLPVAQIMTTGWYVTDANHDTFDKRITVKGNVNLILKDDTVLKANAGIEVPAGGHLYIWAQSTDDRMGRLEAKRAAGLRDRSAGLGCDRNGNAGYITINGGNIWATGSPYKQEYSSVHATGGPGISGYKVTINGGDITATGKGHADVDLFCGAGINGNTIVINGGTVDATGGQFGGAGIGSNYKYSDGNITINGGTVTATGGGYGGAGIGGGDNAAFIGSIKITGGTVTAKGIHDGAGIGSSCGDYIGTVTISGGTVTAIGSAFDKYYGPGIGGDDFKGTVKITGGNVTATGGNYCAGIGSRSGRNAKAGHVIIEGGTVKAKGGEGAAGIGGGKENVTGTGGEGCDDVQITGGTVFAQSGTGSCSAIGHGDDDEDYGKITFANGMCVRADTRTDGDMNGAYERDGKPFLWQGKDSVDGRMSACQYRHTALITECEHAATKGENDGIIHVDRTSHIRSACAYCKRPSAGEPHTYDESNSCTVCGYKQTICTVSFDANGGSGTMGVMWAAPGGTITLPECGFAAPENKAFAGWDVNGETVDENKPVKISKDTIVKAVWAEAYPLWIGGARVTAVNKMDIFGNGTAKYEGNSSEGTLTLDGAKISASQVYDREKELSAGIIGKLPDQLRIVVNSNSVINVDADQGIYSAGPLAISGSGRLSVHGKSGIGCDSHITILDGSVAADSDAFGSGIFAKGNLNINNSKVTATGMECGVKAFDVCINGGNSVVTARADSRDGSAIKASGIISIKDGLTIASPADGKIGKAGSSSITTVLDKNDKAANEAVISKPLSYDVWVGQTQVTSANCKDVLEDGSVSYEPDRNILTFTRKKPSISSVHNTAMIWSDDDLVVVAPEGGLTLENTGAATGIYAAGDLALVGSMTINVKNQAIFAAGDLNSYGGLTARGMGSTMGTGGLIEANGKVDIFGNLNGYNKTGYGLRAGNYVEIADDVKLNVATGSVISAGEFIDIYGSLDTISFDGESLVPTDGLKAKGDISVHGNVKIIANQAGIRSEEGVINVETGKWEVNNTTCGTAAMDAIKINIPETHGITAPEGGEVKAYTSTSGQATREAVYNGNNVAKYATISWQSPKPEGEPGVPCVTVTPDSANMTYGGAEGESRTLTANVTVDPESVKGTLHYRWQKQEKSGYWQSVANGVDVNEYTVPADEPVGTYQYRCLVTNTFNDASVQAVSNEVTVTIDKAAAKVITEPRKLSLTYSGKPQRLAMGGSAGGGTMLYSLDNKSWSRSVPSQTKAGTYALYYMVQGDENHNDVSGGQIDVSIAKRKLVITADPKEKNYGEPDPALTYQVEGLASGDRLTGQLTREKGEAVGTYAINARTIEPEAYCKGNYTIIPQGAVLTIYPAGGGGGSTPVEDPVQKVKDMIDALPSPDAVTAKDSDAVKAASEAYEALKEPEEKDLIEKERKEKLWGCERALANQDAAGSVTALIDKLPDDPSKANAEDVAAAAEAYKGLTDGQKRLISEANAKKLEDAVKYPAKARKVTLKTVKAKKGRKAQVKWKKTSAASGYQMVYSTSKKFTKKTTKKVTVKSRKVVKRTVKKLKAKKKYYFKIRTYTSVYNPITDSTEKVYGKWSKGKRIKAKK